MEKSYWVFVEGNHVYFRVGFKKYVITAVLHWTMAA